MVLLPLTVFAGDENRLAKDNLDSVSTIYFADNWDWMRAAAPSNSLEIITLTINDLSEVKAICDAIRKEEDWQDKWLNYFAANYLRAYMADHDNKVLYAIDVFPDGFISIGEVNVPLKELLNFHDSNDYLFKKSVGWGKLGRNANLARDLVNLAMRSPAEKKKFEAIKKWTESDKQACPIENDLYGPKGGAGQTTMKNPEKPEKP